MVPPVTVISIAPSPYPKQLISVDATWIEGELELPTVAVALRVHEFKSVIVTWYALAERFETLVVIAEPAFESH